MKKILALMVVAITMGAGSAPVIAQEFDKEIKARQSVMRIFAFNLGILGGMAKGDMEYDATTAQNAANNLNAAVMMQNGPMWPMGSDLASPGMADKTRAKSEIWANFPMVMEKHQTLAVATTTMASAVGTGVDAIRANIGAVGKGCQGCHQNFRAEKN